MPRPDRAIDDVCAALSAAGVGVFDISRPEPRRIAGDPAHAAAAAAGGADTPDLRVTAKAGASLAVVQANPPENAAAGAAGRWGLAADLRAAARDAAADPALGPVACVVFNVDGMREFSRAYGFDASDQLALAARDQLRAAAPQLGPLRRIGGAKFGVAAPATTLVGARALAEVCVADVAAASFDLGFGAASVTVSVGAAVAPAETAAAPETFEAAMTALDDAVTDAADPVRVVDADAGAAPPEEMRAGARFVMRALQGDDVAVALQPVVDAEATDQIAFQECLARLRDVDGGWISAGRFMPRIERLDLVATLDRRVLRKACEALQARPSERLSVNVSARTVADAGWMRELRAAAAREVGAVDRLIVELTESAAVTDAARTKRFLDEVREMGCAIALDDFGAGYSSFRHMRDFRPDWVKIDGGFVRGVARNPDNMLFVDTLVGIARNFDMATVAEFVETAEDAEALRRLGVDCLQGYLFGEPRIARATPGRADREA